MHENRLRPGLRSRPRWGSLQRSPDPIKRVKLLRKEEGNGEGRAKKGEGKSTGGGGEGEGAGMGSAEGAFWSSPFRNQNPAYRFLYAKCLTRVQNAEICYVRHCIVSVTV